MMSSAVTAVCPLNSVFERSGYRFALGKRVATRIQSSAPIRSERTLWRPTDQLFIGQIASETAACSGKIVTKFFAEYCNSTGSAKLFCPISSNLTRRHGMMV
ncbi:hypothetical protein ACVIIY_003083 [Bradyrhizobium sp. USDA 4515]